MRSVALAVYADVLAEHALAAESRIDRVRHRLIRAAIERDARASLPPEVAARLESLGVLAPVGERADGLDAAREEIEHAVADRAAITVLQRWVEEQRAAVERGIGARSAPPKAAA